MEEKLQNLVDIIGEMGSLLVAYSGGVDSTLLLRVAKDVLGNRVVAATARSPTYPQREYEQAGAMASKLGVKHLTVITEELAHPEFFQNPPNRCYYCKRELFGQLRKLAYQQGLNWVVDGTNYDDLGDFRPGMKAALEMAVRSPLKEAGLTKEEIRSLSQRMGLPTWNKPSLACLASRFPYGDRITLGGLQMVAEAEDYLYGLGFEQVRVRHHNGVARIEVPLKEMGRFYEVELRHQVVARLKLIGYTYVTLDLQGYRSGSMNEVLG
ncbi:MAG: ATP-dependent sacrificial sulfur transferase LarE [Dehalococcoidia bacterium]